MIKNRISLNLNGSYVCLPHRRPKLIRSAEHLAIHWAFEHKNEYNYHEVRGLISCHRAIEENRQKNCTHSENCTHKLVELGFIRGLKN